MIARTLLGLAVGLLTAAPLSAQYDPPAGYYAAAEGLTGPALKTALHSIVRGHTIIPYTAGWTDTWDAIKVLDRDPQNSSNVRLVYSDGSVPAWDTDGDGNTSITANSWQREHLWPRSGGVGDTGADTSDLFNLRAVRGSVNASRGNRYYKQAELLHPVDPARVPPNCPECLYDYNNGQGSIWTPRPAEKGDIARALFYMAVRYDGRDADTLDLELSQTPNDAAGIFSFLETLLQWHAEDPVSEAERLRNHIVYTQYQRNRNPFIDRPEMVQKVFGAPSELPALIVTVTPSVVREGQNVTARVSIPNALPQALTVRLVKVGAAAADVTLPADVTVSAGQTSVDFDVPAAADTAVDGDKELSIIGLAPSYESGAASLIVLDAQGSSTGATSSTVITGAGYYTQNFDTLPSAGTNNWTDNSTLSGWYAARSGTGSTIIAGTGGSGTGGLYSFGNTGSTDRALGSVGSDASGGFAWGVAFQNGTSGLLTLTAASFVGEQWRSGNTNSAAQTLGFYYRIGSGPSDLTPASDASWTLLSGFNFTSPVINAPAGALNGNLAANSAVISSGLDLLLAPDAWITFRWRDVNHGGDDHGLGIDNFRLDWSVQPPGAKPVVGNQESVAALGQTFSYQAVATGNPLFYEAEDLPPGLICNANGTITGIPQAAGVFTVRLLAVNGAGAGNGTLILTVQKALPAIVTAPTAATIRLGQPLSAATLTGGAASVPGSFAFADPLLQPPFGIAPRTVIFTPTDSVNYGTVSLQVAVAVNYATGFESASKGSFGSSDVELDGVSWNMTEALVGGGEVNDFKIGTKSARLRGYSTSSMTMLADLPGGIGTVSFQHRRYGTDTQVQWIVERSTNQGAAWVEIGRFTAGASVATFNANLDLALPARLRIRTAATGTSNRRTNIDDIVITPYVAPALPLPVITSPLLVAARYGTPFTYQMTASNSPDIYEIEDLPAGLVVDPLVPGRITGTPEAAGSFAVTLRAVNATGPTTATLQLDVARSDIRQWSGTGQGEPIPAGLLVPYAVGGASSPQGAREQPIMQIDGSHLVLSAVVRTDDPGLSVIGEAAGEMTEFGTTSAATVPGEVAADQTDVPVGHEHRLYRVPIVPGDDKKFLRLRVELGPP